MATPPEQPWSNHERNYLLAEIIKAHNPHHEHLLNVIRRLGIEPRWEETPLPTGRSLNSSRFAYDSMQRSLPTPTLSMSSMGPQTPMTIPVPTLKRPFPPSEAPYSASGREIRPKPLMGATSGYSQPSPSEPPPKRKRGRPTKAEQQAKADAAAAAAAMSFEARPAPSRSLLSASNPAAGRSPVEEVKPMLPPTTRMPIASMLTPTTQAPKSASNSSSSSGKKRRGRSAKSEPEETPTARSRGDYDSPRDLRAAPDDSPARTAVLRHREEVIHPTRLDPPRPSPESGQQHPHQPPYQHHQPRQPE